MEGKELVKIIVEFIKEQKKLMGDKSNITLPIEYNNWGARINGKFIWKSTTIMLGNKELEITDREISESSFVSILENALDESGVKGRVFSRKCGDGYWCPKETYFERVDIYGKPCKEFNELNRLFVKYGENKLDETYVFSVGICGKRTTYDDSGKYRYLCHSSKKCQAIIDFIKANKGRNGEITRDIKAFVDNGDEEEYRIAQYLESEWYGSRGYSLTIKIKNGKGKKDYSKTFVV
jgi:hypothetical protein